MNFRKRLINLNKLRLLIILLFSTCVIYAQKPQNMDEVNILIDNNNVDSVYLPEIRKVFKDYLITQTKEALLWANNLSIKVKNEKLLVKPEVLFEIAQELDMRNHLLIADDLYLTAKDIYEKNGDYESVLTQDNHIAYNKIKKGEYEAAFKMINDVIKVAKEGGYIQQIAESYWGLAFGYMHLAEFEKALENAELFMEYCKKMENFKFLDQAYYFYAKILSAVGEENKALINYRKVLEFENSTINGIVYRDMSVSYNTLQQTDSSFFNARKAVQHLSLIKDYDNLTTSYGYLGRLLYQHGYDKEGKLYIDSCILLGVQQRDFQTLTTINNFMSDYYARHGDYKQSLEYFQFHSDYSDSLMVEESNNQFLMQEARSRGIVQQNELVLLEKENEVQKLKINQTRLALAGAAVLLILTFLFIYIYRLRSINKMAELKQQLTRFQMNPHFIFNSLNSLQNFILENDIRSTNKYLSMFSTLMRGTLENSYHNIISVNEELKHLELYLHLESLRFDHKFEYNISVDQDIDVNHFKIPSLIIQPFVENAIWHGLLNVKKGERKLIIKLHLSDKQIICEVEDNGVGREKAMEIISGKGKEHKSLGTKITDQRLKILSAIHKREFSVNYKDLIDVNGNPSGTRVNIILPLVI